MGRFDDLRGDDSPPADEIILDPSWIPVELGPVLAGRDSQPVPAVLHRDDGQCLLYLGAINGVHGDSGIGKGWTACLAIVQQLQRGHTVMLIDCEDTAASIVARCRMLGARDDELAARLIYVRPQAEFGQYAVEHLCTLAAVRGVRLVVVDSLGEAFGLDGVDENHDAEVGPWLRRVARKLADAGPAVLLVDHSTKAGDNPLHPSGSKRKRAAIGGASYLVTSTVPLAAGAGGRLRIVCAKDRHGTYARGEHVADLVMTPNPYGGVRVELYAPAPTDLDPELPIVLAARDAVRAARSESPRPLSQRELVGHMTIKCRDETKRAGIDLALGRGALEETAGGRNARLFRYVRDLDEATEP